MRVGDGFQTHFSREEILVALLVLKSNIFFQGFDPPFPKLFALTSYVSPYVLYIDANDAADLQQVNFAVRFPGFQPGNNSFNTVNVSFLACLHANLAFREGNTMSRTTIRV